MISLTKWLDPADYQQPDLQESLRIVDLVGIPGQHEHRRWEYALALRAIQQAPPGLVLDVGGAGSSFADIVRQGTDRFVYVIDPQLPSGPLAIWRHEIGVTAPVVTCLSVLEHLSSAEFPGFLQDLRACVQRHGILFLTLDAALEEGPDTHHFSWMRTRIFSPSTWGDLRAQFLQHGFEDLAGVDAELHPPAVYDYSFATLAFRRS